jgi:hypothetical protein
MVPICVWLPIPCPCPHEFEAKAKMATTTTHANRNFLASEVFMSFLHACFFHPVGELLSSDGVFGQEGNEKRAGERAAGD